MVGQSSVTKASIHGVDNAERTLWADPWVFRWVKLPLGSCPCLSVCACNITVSIANRAQLLILRLAARLPGNTACGWGSLSLRLSSAYSLRKFRMMRSTVCRFRLHRGSQCTSPLLLHVAPCVFVGSRGRTRTFAAFLSQNYCCRDRATGKVHATAVNLVESYSINSLNC